MDAKMTATSTIDQVTTQTEPKMARGFQTQWDDEQRQTHYALCSDGVVLECVDIAYPFHISKFGGFDGKWVVSNLKEEDLQGLEFIGNYLQPVVSA